MRRDSSAVSGRTTRDSEGEVAGRHAVAGRDHRSRSHLRAALHHRAVEHPRADADQRAVLDGAAVHHRLVADHHAGADLQRMGAVGNVQHRAVLHVGARADADEVDVAARRGVEPEGDVVAQLDVAHHVRVGSEEDALAQHRPAASVGIDGHRGPSRSAGRGYCAGLTEKRMRW